MRDTDRSNTKYHDKEARDKEGRDKEGRDKEGRDKEGRDKEGKEDKRRESSHSKRDEDVSFSYPRSCKRPTVFIRISSAIYIPQIALGSAGQRCPALPSAAQRRCPALGSAGQR